MVREKKEGVGGGRRKSSVDDGVVELRWVELSWESDEMSVDNKNLGLGLGYVVELLNQLCF